MVPNKNSSAPASQLEELDNPATEWKNLYTNQQRFSSHNNIAGYKPINIWTLNLDHFFLRKFTKTIKKKWFNVFWQPFILYYQSLLNFQKGLNSVKRRFKTSTNSAEFDPFLFPIKKLKWCNVFWHNHLFNNQSVSLNLQIGSGHFSICQGSPMTRDCSFKWIFFVWSDFWLCVLKVFSQNSHSYVLNWIWAASIWRTNV